MDWRRRGRVDGPRQKSKTRHQRQQRGREAQTKRGCCRSEQACTLAGVGGAPTANVECCGRKIGNTLRRGEGKGQREIYTAVMHILSWWIGNFRWIGSVGFRGIRATFTPAAPFGPRSRLSVCACGAEALSINHGDALVASLEVMNNKFFSWQTRFCVCVLFSCQTNICYKKKSSTGITAK